MRSQVLLVGNGLLAGSVDSLLRSENVCQVVLQPEVPSEVQGGIDLALVLDDAWNPSVHIISEGTFRAAGVPWLRGFVAFGNGIMGPLVYPETTGCTQCADLRLLMAESERHEMVKLRGDFAARGGSGRDAWATRTGLLHLAHIVVAETRHILQDAKTSQVDGHIMSANLLSLETTRHFILPDAACTVCGSLPEDTPEASVITLDPVPKASADSFRTKPLHEMTEQLTHDYLDYAAGLLNGKAYDFITPFASVSVNLPLWMGDEGTSGRAHSYRECEPIAILEGVERFCGVEPRGKQTVVYGAYADLKDRALNPLTVGLHAPKQYASAGFPFWAFDETVETDWVWGYSLTAQKPILVPLRLAYYSLDCDGGFVFETSNGCALGSNLVEAIFHGILEVVERDAFLMTWYARLALLPIDVASTEDRELRWMIGRVRAVTGYDLHMYNATMENGIPTVFVIAKNTRANGLNLLCSAGASLDPMRAIKGAIHETAGMLLRFDEKLEANRETYLNMLQDSRQVRQMEDHSMLYGLPEAQERLGFLLDGKRPAQTIEQAFTRKARHLDLVEDLRDLLNTFQRLNLDVIVVNQTSPEIEKNGLHCVKVLIPGMLPMTFGHQFTRLEHLDRVLRVPMTLGFRDTPLTREQLNANPHPFP